MVILALPRSRTYWISRFLSTKNKEFLHEGGGNKKLEIIGNISTVPSDRADLIVERDFDEVIASLGKIFPMGGIEPEIRRQKENLDKVEAPRIQFNEINDNLEYIWGLVHKENMDVGRAEVMKHIVLENTDLIRCYNEIYQTGLQGRCKAIGNSAI